MLKSVEQQNMIEFRQDEVFKLYLQGYSQRELAKKFNVSPNVIQRDIEDKLQEYRKEALEDTLNIRTMHVQTMRVLLRDRFEDLSLCQDEYDDRGKLVKNGIRDKGTVIKDIIVILQDLGRVFGIYAPEKIEQLVIEHQDDLTKTIDIDFENATTEQLKIAYAELVKKEGEQF